jgi:flagellar hook-associated protein 2
MTTTSSTGSATQSLVTALGGGSGIDMQALANNLAEAQFANRTDRLNAKADTLDKQISTASDLKSMLLSLASSLGDRVRIGDLSPQPSVANPSVAQASLSGTRTPSGSYTLEVTTVAQAQNLASPAFANSTDPVGSGTLTLRFGTIAAGAFTEDAAHTAANITVPAGASLSDVAAAINGARAGVQAYVAQTTEGAKLVLKGSDGAANSFVLEAAETPGDEGLASLAWNPAAPGSGRLLASAGNAAFQIDGLAMTSPSNTITDAIPGVTLKLGSTNAGTPTRVTFSDPTATITTAMQDLTSALNEVSSAVRSATDPKTGDLARDSGALALKRTFSMLAGKDIMPNAAASAPRRLADLGLATQRDGSFQFDAKKLTAAIKSDPQAVAAMFTNGIFGVFATIDSLSRNASKISDPGALGGSIARYQAQKSQVSTEQGKLTEKQDALRAQLIQRFAVSDNRIGSSKATLSMIQNQIAAWNNSGN